MDLNISKILLDEHISNYNKIPHLMINRCKVRYEFVRCKYINIGGKYKFLDTNLLDVNTLTHMGNYYSLD